MQWIGIILGVLVLIFVLWFFAPAATVLVSNGRQVVTQAVDETVKVREQTTTTGQTSSTTNQQNGGSSSVELKGKVAQFCGVPAARLGDLVEGNGFVNPQGVKLLLGKKAECKIPAGWHGEFQSGSFIGPVIIQQVEVASFRNY